MILNILFRTVFCKAKPIAGSAAGPRSQPHAKFWLDLDMVHQKQLLQRWRSEGPTRGEEPRKAPLPPLKLEYQVLKRWAALQKELDCLDRRQDAARKVQECQEGMRGASAGTIVDLVYKAELSNTYM